MTTAPQHAERILEACLLANPNRFESELEQAWHSCRSCVPSSGLEGEQQELLATIVENWRARSIAQHACHPARLGAEFSLLKHLCGQVVSTQPRMTRSC